MPWIPRRASSRASSISKGAGLDCAGAARCRAHLHGAGRQARAADLPARRQLHGRARLPGADARRQADALLPGRRQAARCTCRWPWSRTSSRRPGSSCMVAAPKGVAGDRGGRHRPHRDLRGRRCHGEAATGRHRQRHGGRARGRGDPRARRRRHVRHHHVRRRAVRQLQPHPAVERAERRRRTRARSSSTRWPGTRRTASACTPACAVDADRPRTRKVVQAANGVREPYDKLIIATGSRAFIPPIEGVFDEPGGSCRPGVFGFRTLDDCHGIIAAAGRKQERAVIGGGLLGLEAARGLLNHGCEVHVIHLAGHLMEAAARCPAAAPSCARRWRSMGITVHLGQVHRRGAGRGARVTGLAFKDGTHARLRHGGDRRRHQAQRGARPARRPDRRARHRRRQPHALGRRLERLRRRRMRAAPRRGLRPGGAAVGAGQGAGRPHHRPQPATPPITARSSPPSSR